MPQVDDGSHVMAGASEKSTLPAQEQNTMAQVKHFSHYQTGLTPHPCPPICFQLKQHLKMHICFRSQQNHLEIETINPLIATVPLAQTAHMPHTVCCGAPRRHRVKTEYLQEEQAVWSSCQVWKPSYTRCSTHFTHTSSMICAPCTYHG